MKLEEFDCWKYACDYDVEDGCWLYCQFCEGKALLKDWIKLPYTCKDHDGQCAIQCPQCEKIFDKVWDNTISFHVVTLPIVRLGERDLLRAIADYFDFFYFCGAKDYADRLRQHWDAIDKIFIEFYNEYREKIKTHPYVDFESDLYKKFYPETYKPVKECCYITENGEIYCHKDSKRRKRDYINK
jgi:hypothetical protein